MENLKARMIIEIMGRPPEHIKEALNTLVVKMGSENGVKLIDKRYHDPKSVKEAKNLHITFAEVDAEFDSLENFFSVIMGYMPSNVEIYEPEKFKLNSNEINSLSNYIMSKLHRYDEIAKRSIVERDILLRQLQALVPGKKTEQPAKPKETKSKSKVKKKK